MTGSRVPLLGAALLCAAVLLAPGRVVAQLTIQPPFDASYSAVDLGAVPSLPPQAGGLTFLRADPDTLLIGGNANQTNAAIYRIGVVRGTAHHITGFTGTATSYAAAGSPAGGIDGGLSFGPNGVLFFTTYNDNRLGQIKPGSTSPDSFIVLTSLSPTPIPASVGALAFVPPGFPGAGRLKIAQYLQPGNWYDVTLTAPLPDGTFGIASVSQKVALASGPEGFIYIAAGNPQITADSVLVTEYSQNRVSAYSVDGNGDPLLATRRSFITGLVGAEGATIDPLTGDFLFSTFGGGNRVIVVRGFLPPPTTSTTTPVTTTTGPTPPTTTSTPPTTTTSVSNTSTTAVSLPPPTTTTVPGACVTAPAATFLSVSCRLANLTTTTRQTSELGALAAKLLGMLGRAAERADAAASACGAGDAKRARSRMRQAGRGLIQYTHRLQSNAARRKVPREVRTPLAAASDAIRGDLAKLKAGLACPTDAPRASHDARLPR